MIELHSARPHNDPPLAALRLGLWAVESHEPGLFRFTANRSHQEYFVRLAEQFLTTTDFHLLIPVGTNHDFDRLAHRYRNRITLFRGADSLPSADESPQAEWTWLRDCLSAACSLWLCPGVEYRESIDQFAQREAWPTSVTREEFGGNLFHFSPGEMESTATLVLHLQQALAHHQGEVVEFTDWRPPCTSLLKIFRRAWSQRLMPLASQPGPFELWLFLGYTYFGGVWESIRQLLTELVAINHSRGELRLTLLVTPEQDLSGLEGLAGKLTLDRLDWKLCPRHQVIWDSPTSFVGQAESAPLYGWPQPLRPTHTPPDAVFALTDRFNVPFAPRVPLGVWIYDLIQLEAPDCFDASFWEAFQNGMKPTLAQAELALVPSLAVQESARRGYGLPEKRMRVIPVACEPHKRFGTLSPQAVEAANRPFLLQVAVAAPHKGARLLLQAAAIVKQKLGPAAPLFVLGGHFTDQFSSRYTLPITSDYVLSVREEIRESGLVEGQDFVILGSVSDAELAWLYTHCLGVINAAKYDNGSFNLIEGHYFGRPLVSSDYPGVRELAERFELPVRYFAVDDAAELAQAVEELAQQPPPSDEKLTAIREKLQRPEYSVRVQSERIYELLVELGRRGYERRVLRG